MDELTHLDDQGKARMVDISHKPIQTRTATASGFISLQAHTLTLIRQNQIKKGDVLTVAEIAGILAAKRTSELIPLCHPLQTTKVEISCQILDHGVQVNGFAKCIGQTGIEMEVLTGVSLALLTIYDMCKAVDKTMQIGEIRLTDKQKHDL